MSFERGLVSVIVPCFNYGVYLTSALESVSKQTYCSWECIVVDDGSTDNTAEIVSDFRNKDNRFKYFYQENKGLSAARNSGMREASGAYLQFLDADDLLERDKLALHVGFLEKAAGVDAVYSDAAYFPSEEPEKRFSAIDGKATCNLTKISGGRDELLKFLLRDNIVVVSSPVLRRTVTERYGFFDEGLRALEDWDYWLRCFMGGMKMAYLPTEEPCTLIRFHPGSVSKNRFLMLQANLAIRQRIHGALGDKDLEAINSAGAANARFALAVEMARNGKVRAAAAELASFSLLRYKFCAMLRRFTNTGRNEGGR